jgi:16S rRNA (uracil1498-N3)-methyltransferase
VDELFYAPTLPQGDFTLDAIEAHHCMRVKRHKIGDRIQVFDGVGGLYEAEIVSADKATCTFRVQARKQADEPVVQVHVGVAPPKNPSRFEWLVEKLVEVGVSRITPISCQRSERARLNTDRLRRIVIEAAKQSGKLWLPTLDEMIPFESVLITESKARFIAHLGSESQALKDVYNGEETALVLIGPEGDFTGDELQTAKDSGCKQVTLGQHRLRTETAALVACHTINLLHD